jgi:hypothetical protein
MDGPGSGAAPAIKAVPGRAVSRRRHITGRRGSLVTGRRHAVSYH